MKKSANKTTVAALLMFLLVMVCSQVKVLAQLPFNDGFESGNFITGGWAVSGGAQVSTQSPSQGLYCAQGAATYGLLKTIPSIPDSIIFVEFDIKASQTNTTCLIFRIRDNNFGTSAGFFLNNLGQIMGVNGPTPPIVLLNYAVDQWYKILFEMNMNTETYDLYIDGILFGNDFNFYTPGFGIPRDFSWSSVAATGSAWVDGVSIYSGVPTGSETISLERTTFVFPNPASDEMVVRSSEFGDQKVLTVFSASGEKIFSGILSKTNTVFDMNKISPGLYFLNIRDEKGNLLHAEKIVKQ